MAPTIGKVNKDKQMDSNGKQDLDKHLRKSESKDSFINNPSKRSFSKDT